MNSLPEKFVIDRSLRDAARALVVQDIERLRSSLDGKGIASRVSSGVSSTISTRLRTGAHDVLAQAKAQAGDHKGVLAVLVGAIVLWLGRGPILGWFDEFIDIEDEMDAADPEAAPEGDPV